MECEQRGLLEQDQAEKEGTVESLVLWTVVGRPADGRRTVVSGACVVSGAEYKNNLIEAAPFARLDQMLGSIV